jgi:hypothetical protein
VGVIVQELDNYSGLGHRPHVAAVNTPVIPALKCAAHARAQSLSAALSVKWVVSRTIIAVTPNVLWTDGGQRERK